MAREGKIDSVYDFTDKGLKELESWLEPWFLTRNGNAVSVEGGPIEWEDVGSTTSGAVIRTDPVAARLMLDQTIASSGIPQPSGIGAWPLAFDAFPTPGAFTLGAFPGGALANTQLTINTDGYYVVSFSGFFYSSDGNPITGCHMFLAGLIDATVQSPFGTLVKAVPAGDNYYWSASYGVAIPALGQTYPRGLSMLFRLSGTGLGGVIKAKGRLSLTRVIDFL